MRRLLPAMALLILLGQGCFESHPDPGIRPTERPDGGDLDAGRPTPPPPPGRPPPPPGMAGTFVISILRAPEASFGGISVGSDVDGVDSGDGSLDVDANCEEFNADFVSPDGRRGVDNAYGGLIGTIESVVDGSIDGHIARAIVAGDLLLVLEVSGSPPSEVSVWVAAPSAPLESTGGRLDPGNVLLGLTAIGRGRARADGSHIVARIDGWSAPLPPEVIPFLPIGALRDVELRFDLTPSGISRGQLGAWFTIEESIEAGRSIAPDIEETLRSVLESVSDIEPSRLDPAVCEGLSVGLAFEAVPVVLER